MPGLIGIVGNNRSDETLLNRMIDSIKYEEWYKVDKYSDTFYSAARVDLGIFNSEPQPVFNEDKTLCIFMYGKVYGYEEGIKDLRNKGHQFNVNNDCEYCLHSYEEYGEDFVNSLNGSFVLVIYDFKRKKIVIVNDRYGLRPFYYAMSGGKLLFASEVKAILKDREFHKKLNDETIAKFFAFRGEISDNKTFFEGIEVLPPASVFTYDGSNINIKQYWDFDYQPDYSLSEREIVDSLCDAFTRAVDIRMRDNLRYGIFLSGGLDSRLIVGAMDKERRRDVVAVTFGPLECDEVKVAKAVSSKANMRHIVVEVTPNEIITPYSEDVVRITDGMDTISVGHQLLSYMKIKNQFDVAFDGLVGSFILGGDCLDPPVFKAKNNEDLAMMIHARRLFSDHELRGLFNADYYARIKDVPRVYVEEYLDKLSGHPANKLNYFLLDSFAKGFTFHGDRVVRSLVEQASPTYDNSFMDIIVRIPPELRANHRIFRKLLIKLAPELAAIPYQRTMVRADAPLLIWRLGVSYQHKKELIKLIIRRLTRGKINLPNKRSYINFPEWLRSNDNWRGYIRGILLDNNACYREYMNREYVETLIQEQEAGTMDHAQQLLFLVTFELFMQMFACSEFDSTL